MASVPARVALLGVEGEARTQLRQVLLDFGAQISIEADPRAVEPAALSAAGSSIILVSLDDRIEDALDAFQPVFDAPGVSVIFDEAEVTRKLGGWELARWARHLTSKLSGDAAAALPAAPDHAQRVQSFDMRPQPGAPIRPDQEMSAATLSEYTSDTPELAREVPALEVPGGGARVAYAPAYVRTDETVDALQLDDDEIARALTGGSDDRPNADHSPTASIEDIRMDDSGIDLSGDIDLTDYVGEPMPTATAVSGVDEASAEASQAGGGDLVVLELDESYLETDFSFATDTASTAGGDDEPTLSFAQFDGSDDEEMALDPELLALAAQLDANTSDDQDGAERVTEYDFARRSDNDGGSDIEPGVESSGMDRMRLDAPAQPPDNEQAANKTSPFANLALVSDDDNSPNDTVTRGHDPVVPTDIDFDALIAGLSLADDDASTVATQQGAVVIFSGAGGPDAVRQVLANLPSDLPVPVVLIQHLDGANHDRLIPQLAKVSTLPVVLAAVGMSVDAGRVFVVPGDLGVSIGRHGNLSFAAEPPTVDVQLAQLMPLGRDLVVALASGAPAALANRLAECVSAGATVIAQDPASCIDAAACASAQVAGGQVGAMAELTAKAVERWKK